MEQRGLRICRRNVVRVLFGAHAGAGHLVGNAGDTLRAVDTLFCRGVDRIFEGDGLEV